MIRPAGSGERWVALFLLALLLFSPPFLSISSEHRLLSIPFIYVYLFVAWGLVIGLIALAVEDRAPGAERAEPADEDGGTAGSG